MSTDHRRLQLAFAYHMARQILEVDEEFLAGEQRFLDQQFPPDLMRELGFFDAADQPLPALAEAANEAISLLPDLLTLGEKLSMMEQLVEASAADGVLAAEEVDALAAAAAMLEIPNDTWQEHVENLVSSGRLSRDQSGV
ncbi:MAG: hypothetical protein H6738_00495 [Alphaproteobacteria bacterium]|nr:hypothetical protein [Alphaproteobacteria bacterium]MCB9695246.1 hypothetical protein [Alphaproteobacteria bacterium]